MWRYNPTWRQSLDSPGAQQMGVLKQILTARPWWKHTPDQSVFAIGAGGDEVLNVAACSSEGDSVIVYLSNPTTVSLNMNKVAAASTVLARWVNTETGEETVIGEFSNTGACSFTTPDSRPDAVLLLDAV
jgi:Putative collagen-binding domain of a collagenase